MKKKLLLGLFVAASCATFALGLSACGQDGTAGLSGPKLPDGHVHDMKYYERIEPTCTAVGTVGYWSCSECHNNYADREGNYYSPNVILSAKGHEFVNGICSKCGTGETQGAEYKINYVLGLQGVKNENPKSYNTGEGLMLFAPERGGWEFLGWYADSEFQTPVPELAVGTEGHKTLYAKWQTIFTLDGGTVTGLTDYGRTCKEVIIDSSINGTPITQIGNNAFQNGIVMSVTLPNGVTSIGDSAFKGCDRLTNILMPDSVTSIGDNAFNGCSDLVLISIGNNVTSIGGYAFNGCKKLMSVAIPDSVTSIGIEAFGSCSGLTSVTIPNSVTSIGGYAFSGCSGLTSVTIPNSVTSIGRYAFSDCSGLTSVHITDMEAWCKIAFGDDYANPLYYVHNLYLNGELVTELVIPDSVTSIGAHAFGGCSGLTSVAIPDSVTLIGDYAFSGCSGLTSVTLPNSVTSIGARAFKGCSGLTSVTLPNSVTSIGARAFKGCSGLTSVTIGNSVTSIGAGAFSDCSGLTSVIFNNVNGWEASQSIDMANSISIPSSELAIPATAARYLTIQGVNFYWKRS